MPIDFRQACHIYNAKTTMAFLAMDHIDLHLEEGGFIALIGRTGCGKSTLIQHLNSLLNPTSGEVEVDGFHNTDSKKTRSKNVKDLRRNVGLVFQFPEYQLFEETVEKDVAFGPKNFGTKPEEALKLAHEALEKVGLDESFYQRSPFELSGGEKRRVAIAGILAMHPKYLVVDEPTAGLDPLGAKDMMDLFRTIQHSGTTVILVTHDMDIVFSYCDQVIVMEEGKIEMVTTPEKLFQLDIEHYSLQTPLLIKTVNALNAKGMGLDESKIRTVKELARAIAEKKK